MAEGLSYIAGSEVPVVVVNMMRGGPGLGNIAPEQDLTLEIRPVMADQELFTTVRYWEGAVDVEGERDGSPVTGRGYVELTGYAE